MADLAVVNAGELAVCGGSGSTAEEKLGVIEEGAFLAESGRITWVGTTKELKRRSFKPRRIVDAGGSLVTPGLVDPHTHAIFAGSREDELERKTAGESYTSILSSGGGIMRTMRDTRKATVRTIAEESFGRISQLLRNGVTTAEVKTGYGQDVASELKMLQAVEALRKMTGCELVSTFLGLHAKPPGFSSSRAYTDFAVKELLPAAAGARVRPSFSDCFCEEGVFSREECRRYLEASKRLGFPLKIHADEFADSGGASLAADLGCVSGDHLGRSNASGIEAMVKSGTIAVLLPGTSLYSGIPYADARGIIGRGCRVALGTDLSPNSWVESPQFVMALACSGMKMTPAEALLGFTRYAAAALSRDDIGSLAVGARCDFVVHAVPSYRFLPYRVGGTYVKSVFKGGRRVYESKET